MSRGTLSGVPQDDNAKISNDRDRRRHRRDHHRRRHGAGRRDHRRRRRRPTTTTAAAAEATAAAAGSALLRLVDAERAAVEHRAVEAGDGVGRGLGVPMVTNAKPRGCPVSRSVGIETSRTSPMAAKAAWTASGVV